MSEEVSTSIAERIAAWTDEVAKVDPLAAEILAAEERREQNSLNLIASENYASRAVRQATASVLTNKYAEGLPGKRFYHGCEWADSIEQLAIDRAKKLFGTDHANVQPHAGSQANMAVYFAVLKPGDTILGMNLSHGGHLTHGLGANFSGRIYKSLHYGINRTTERIDMDQVREMALKHRPKLIICGASAYPREIDFAAFGEISRECGAMLMADIAHIAGLVAAGLHNSPAQAADFVTTTTHKTLRGPRSGIAMCKAQYAKALDSAVFPGLQGGPLLQQVAAKAVALAEANRPEFKQYGRSIIDNCQALAEELLSRGYHLVSGGTDNHLLLIDLRANYPDITGQQAADWLERANIVVNKNSIPFDQRPAAVTSGVRLGTPAITTRGLGQDQTRQLAGWIDEVISSNGDESLLARVKQQVLQICEAFPIP
ncbi:MAG: aminotransferase class I/II-fold pyridoxal phosphate-dependent enzyme [Actinobacteria bacterium]|nr:aminotransferase class I/II-fold pyridoxal phosphate-dependent enzyme [Actinomycetota bacterium]